MSNSPSWGRSPTAGAPHGQDAAAGPTGRSCTSSPAWESAPAGTQAANRGWARPRGRLRDAVTAGAERITTALQTELHAQSPKHNVWVVSRTGHYGTDYQLRAVVERIGLGAPVSRWPR